MVRSKLAQCRRAPPSPPPHGKGDSDRSCKREPGDGVLHVIVTQMHVERAGFRNAVLRHRRLQIDVEWGDLRAPLAPAEPARDGEMIAGEPEPRLSGFSAGVSHPAVSGKRM